MKLNLSDIRDSRIANAFSRLSTTGKVVVGVILLLMALFLYNGVRHQFDNIRDYFSGKKVEKLETQTDGTLKEADQSRTRADEFGKQAAEKGVAASEKDTQIEQSRNNVRNIDARLQRERERFALEQQRAREDKDLTALKQETCARLSRLGFECN